MIDMITGKIIVGTPVSILIYKGTKTSEEHKIIDRSNKIVTTYKVEPPIELVVDQKTFKRAKGRTWFSFLRLGCLLYLLEIAIFGMGTIYLLSTLPTLGIILAIVGIITIIVSLIISRNAKMTAEQNLAHWYSEKNLRYEGEQYFTTKEVEALKIKPA